MYYANLFLKERTQPDQPKALKKDPRTRKKARKKKTKKVSLEKIKAEKRFMWITGSQESLFGRKLIDLKGELEYSRKKRGRFGKGRTSDDGKRGTICWKTKYVQAPEAKGGRAPKKHGPICGKKKPGQPGRKGRNKYTPMAEEQLLDKGGK